MIHSKSRVFLGATLAVVMFSPMADAHWCNDLWGSAYNLVVRPESDTVTVPASGSATLNVYVQNNMEYALDGFSLAADIGGKSVTAKAASQVVSGKLMPGEKQKYTLTVSKSGGGSVNATDINFAVDFGSGQAGLYGSGAAAGAKAAMIRKTDGTLFPTPPPPGLGVGNGQATQLFYAATADFGDTAAGLDKLMNLYCSGRGSWNTGSATVIKSNCQTATTTSCPTTTPSSAAGDKFDYMHLWAAGELAIRKSKLDARAAVFRSRLQCGVKDANNGFAGFALMVLGYLGEDAGARTFIEGKIAAGGDLGTIAKAAILLMGSASDMTKYKADVTTGTASSSIFVKAACAAALGIAADDDARVKSVLFPLAKWTEPDTSEDNGQAIYSAQLLNLVAWDRRGWAPQAGDTGAVSFYGETGTAAGGSGGGTGGAPGTGGASGSGGAGGNKDASPISDGKPPVNPDSAGNGGATGTGGAAGFGGAAGGGGKAGSVGAGGAIGAGGATGAGGTTGAGGSTGGGGTTSGGKGGSGAASSGGSSGSKGGAFGSGGDTGGRTTPAASDSAGCNCSLGGTGMTSPTTYVLLLAGLAWIAGRRRRR